MSDELNFTPATDPDEVLGHLDSLLKRIEQGFAQAIPAAARFFVEDKEPIERSLFAGIVRWRLKRYLRQRGVDAEIEAILGYELDDVANIGLIINCDGFQIRILKARDSKVPVSNSDLRKSFYQHNLSFEESSLLPANILNLVVLWETDYVSNVALSVACPKREQSGTTEGRRRVECYWQRPITAPVAVLDSVEFEPLEILDSELEEVVLLEESETLDSQRATKMKARSASKE